MHWSDYRAKALTVLEMVLLGWLILLPPPARAQTGGVSADCNTNGIDDELDIAGGTSADCNLNELPDECDLEGSGVPAQLAKLTAADGAASDALGYSVAISGDTAVVGAIWDDDGGNSSGSAYVFVRSGGVWTEQAKLTAADAGADDYFGYSVALSGDTAVVGAYWDDDAGTDSGSAYVFVRSGGVWTQQAKLTAADAGEFDYFGNSVALSGDTAVVGAYGDDDAGTDSGSAYVFVRSGGVWTEQAKLTAADVAAFDQFGSSVALSGDTVIVGAIWDDDGGTNSGSAYAFVRSGGVWTQQDKLTAADAAPSELFGGSVALSGDTAVVGAYRDDDGGMASGSAYVFLRDGGVWTQQAKLTAADAAANDFFGNSVALSGNMAVIGARLDDDGGTNSGSAYVFVRSGGFWTQRAKLTAADAAANDFFGGSVALSGETAVVGAYFDDDGGTDSGSAYVFDLDVIPNSLDINSNGIPDECEDDCNLNNLPDVLDIAFGTSLDCNFNSLPDECELTTNDCNLSGIPDDCELAAGSADNCNDNAFPDECDVAAGTSDDCNANALPDECDLEPSGVPAQQAKLTAQDAAAEDRFGTSVALSGDTAVIGTWLDDDGGLSSGSAYVFVRRGGVWTQQAKLTATDAAAHDQFGWSVALSGDTAVVGAYENDDGGTDSGSAYVFVRSGGVWTQQAKLTAADPAAEDFFGYSVALSGDTAVVGVLGDDDGGSYSGSAYVFVRSGGVWTQQAKLTAADPAAEDYFGVSVALSGDTVVVGAVEDDDGGTDSGSAYVFVRSGGVWTQQAKLTAADPAAEDFFGWCVTLSGDTAVVSAPADDDEGATSGSAYVFVRSGGVWTQQAKLNAADAALYDQFGWSVALSGDTAVVGAIGDNDGGAESGSGYVFVRSGGIWTQHAKLTAADAAEADFFGHSVALSGDTAVVGAWLDDDGGTDSGSAYVFDLNLVPDWHDVDSNGLLDECEQDCNLNGVSDFFDIAAGTSLDCNFNGLPDECELTTNDCNLSGIPDDCELAAGSADDCNTNAFPDECDLTAGTSEDCNANALPDECDLLPSGVAAQLAKLTAADAFNNAFGRTVSVSGDTAVVGAFFDDDGGADSGSAYVFVRSGGVWTQQAKLTAADAAAGDYFGYSVALSGDTAIFGAKGDDDEGAESGSAYVFVRSGGVWTQQAKLTAADAAAGDWFGHSVALSGDTAVVGAYSDDGGTDSGSVYVFVRSGGVWTQQAKLTAADAAAEDYFGVSVALSGDTVVVGAVEDDDGGTDSGSAYVFVRTGGVWTQQAKLTAPDAAAHDYFGTSIALSGDTAVVGAYYDNDGGSASGSAYVFVRSGGVWTQQAKLTAADAAAYDHFGWSVALSGDTAVVGAYGDNDGGAASGSAYLFDLGLLPDSLDFDSNGIPDECEHDCNLNGVPDFLDIAAGTSLDCNFTGQPDECETAAGTAEDCNANDVPDDCELAAGSADDCNANAIPDECDLTAGTSEDCNANALLDECDLVPSGDAAQLAKLTSADAAPFDYFGYSVALSGDTAVVGADSNDDGGSNSGSAYVFVRSAGVWTQQAKLTAQDAAAGDQFGRSVSVSSDSAVVGAWLDDDGGTDSGSAYVFVRSGGVWTQQAKLTAADATGGDNFGISVALNGDTAVVGAYRNDDAGTDSGSAYVFVRSGGVWTQQAKLTAADAAAGDFFGFSVALSGDTAVVGAYADDDGDTSSGSAYVFVRSGGVWTQQAKLTAADAAANDVFGTSVALSGDTAVVGAYRDDAGGTDSGSAYVFVRSGGVWTQQAKLTAADAAANDVFGYTVALSGDTAVVGAHWDDDRGTDSGSAYVFVRSDGVWTQQAKFTAGDNAPQDHFGVRVSLSGDTAVVGARYDDDGGTDSGSAYVFDLGFLPDSLDLNSNGIPDECEQDCNLNGVPDDLDIAAGTSEDCNFTGLPDECELAAGTAEDCNANAVPDECDVDTDEDGLPDGCDPCAGGAMSGDADGDGDVDGADLADLASCLSGPGGGLGAGCECFDFDEDGDIDLIDFAILQEEFTGPGG